MKGLIAFSLISLLAGSQSFATKAQAIFHSRAPLHSQEELHESVNGELHDKEPWEVEGTPEASETPEATATPTVSPTPTASPTETPTASPTVTPSASPTESATPTESPTASPLVTTTTLNAGTGSIADLIRRLVEFLQSLGSKK